jgi:hypothetical protein
MSVDATTEIPADTAAARCYAALPPDTWLPTRAICERAGLGYVSDGPLWTLYRHGRVTAQNGPPVRRWCRKEQNMSETNVDYHTDRDSGDETDAGSGDTAAPTPWMGRFDATYWQAQAETAIHALEQALDTLARVEAERDAAVAQLTSVKRQLAQTGDTLHAERRAAVAQQRRSHLD